MCYTLLSLEGTVLIAKEPEWAFSPLSGCSAGIANLFLEAVQTTDILAPIPPLLFSRENPGLFFLRTKIALVLCFHGSAS